MTRRIAAVLSLIAFATCVVQGILAENSFGTVLGSSLQALVVMLVVGGIIGVVLEKMLAENVEKAVSAENSGAEAESANR